MDTLTKKQRNKIYRNVYIENFNRNQSDDKYPFPFGLCFALLGQGLNDKNSKAIKAVEMFPEFALFKPFKSNDTDSWYKSSARINERFTCLAFCIAMTE